MIWLLVDSSGIGGIERHIATLAAALNTHGIANRIVLLAAHGTNPWLIQLQEQNLDFCVLPGGLRHLLSAVAREKPDLIHTHGYKANILGRLAAKRYATPNAATFHAGERGAFPVNIYQSIDEWTSIMSERLAVSETIRAQLPFSSRLANNFLSVNTEPPSAPLPRRIAFIGRLSHEKGPDRFCEMAQSIGNTFEWHAYGDGPMRAELEHAFGQTVQFHGLVLNLNAVWNSTGLLVMPSRAEGMPMAALEALSAGVPILASAVGGLPSIVRDGKTGWLFDGRSLDDARAKISLWANLEVEAQRAMRLACWSLARTEYSVTSNLPTILSAYQAAGFTLPTQPLQSA